MAASPTGKGIGQRQSGVQLARNHAFNLFRGANFA